jgi:hypothetical protein
MQPLGPREKGWLASRVSSLFSVVNHLSGLKESGSEKFAGSKLAAVGMMETAVLYQHPIVSALLVEKTARTVMNSPHREPTGHR